MEILSIEGTDDTPKVILNKEGGLFEISGRSLPEDSPEFFKPVLDWISNYKNNPNDTTRFIFKLEYANTASSKLIQEILLSLERINGVTIFWYYEDDDEDMEEMGNELSGLVDIPFEFRTN